MRIINLQPKMLTVGWTVGCLTAAVRPVISGLAAAFFLKATYRMDGRGVVEPWPGKPEFPSGDVLIDGDPRLGLRYASDFVAYKPRADFAVIGTARPPTPGQKAFMIRAKVGAKSKSLHVYGERAWRPSLLGEIPGRPAPVEPVRLTYAHAWGGVNDPRNPLGRGRDDDRLPAFEFPEALVTGRNTMVEPAGFSPLPAGWSQRRGKLGTYDRDWIEHRWPWLPPDFDWSYHNAAPAGQWMDGYLTGNEALEFENLHAAHPVFRARLPGQRARCFLTTENNGRETFTEVPLELDTLWADLDEEKLVLVWRGRTPVRSLKLLEARHLLALLEPGNEPRRPSAHYGDLLAEKLARPRAGDASAKPPRPNNDAVNAEMAARVAPLEKTLDELPAKMEALKDEQLRTFNAHGGKWTPEMPPQARSVEDFDVVDQLRKQARTAAAGLPAGLDASAFAAAMDGAQAAVDRLGAFRKEMAGEIAAFQAKVAGAQMPRVGTGGGDLDPAEIRRAGLPRRRLDGVDFSGHDLSGADFSGASLRGAKFARSKLAGAKLIGAKLGGADFTAASLRGADLSGADLRHGIVAQADFAGARLDRTTLAGLDLSTADFSGVQGRHIDARRCHLARGRFARARLPRALFDGAEMSGADFSEASLEDADFSRVRARGIRLPGARLAGCRAGRQADFTDGDFRGIMAPGSIWKTALLDGANFQGADLTRAMFSQASAAHANFDRCLLTDATFEDARLPGATLTHANLLRARLDRADLTGAKLSGSNLYGAGLWEAVLLHAVWRGANVKRTKLAP